MEKVNIGMIGARTYGSYHIRIYSCDPHVETVVFYDLNEERGAAIQNRYQIRGYVGVKEMVMIEKLDAIGIMIPDPHYYEPAKAAMEAGIRYPTIEKSLTTSAEECEELITIAEKYGVWVAVGFHKHWGPAYNNTRDEVLMNKENIVHGCTSLGDVIDVPMNWFTWADQSSLSWFLGVHCYDLIRYVSDSEAESVYAVGNKQVLRKQDYQTCDSTQAILMMQNGSS